MSNARELSQVPNITEGFKNRIINGDMRIDQRNAGASVTPSTGTYTLDRWQGFSSQASKFTVQQNAGSVTPPAGFTNYLGCTSSSAYTVGASEVFMVRQFIEGFNVADLGFGTANAKTVTLSFWVRSSLTGTFGGALQNDNALSNRSYPFSYTISAANTWEQKSITIVGDTTGTWRTTTATGLTVGFSLGTGSTLSGTAGTWAGSNFLSATGATSVVGTNGATFYITGVQLEEGSVATEFDRLSYGTQLSLCQRYAEVTSVIAVSHVLTINSAQYAHLFFKETKRAVPTYSVLSGAWQNATPSGVYLNSTTARFETAGTAFFSNDNVTVLFNAEL
jgi:hypothetical protein